MFVDSRSLLLDESRQDELLFLLLPEDIECPDFIEGKKLIDLCCGLFSFDVFFDDLFHSVVGWGSITVCVTVLAFKLIDDLSQEFGLEHDFAVLPLIFGHEHHMHSIVYIAHDRVHLKPLT